MESRGRARERVDHDHAAASRSQSSKREVTFPRGGASKEERPWKGGDHPVPVRRGAEAQVQTITHVQRDALPRIG